MTHRKPYRIQFRQVYHYFENLKSARGFIQKFEQTKIEKPFVIEKLNPIKMANNKYTYTQMYDNYEVWLLTHAGWTAKKVGSSI